MINRYVRKNIQNLVRFIKIKPNDDIVSRGINAVAALVSTTENTLPQIINSNNSDDSATDHSPDSNEKNEDTDDDNNNESESDKDDIEEHVENDIESDEDPVARNTAQSDEFEADWESDEEPEARSTTGTSSAAQNQPQALNTHRNDMLYLFKNTLADKIPENQRALAKVYNDVIEYYNVHKTMPRFIPIYHTVRFNEELDNNYGLIHVDGDLLLDDMKQLANMSINAQSNVYVSNDDYEEIERKAIQNVLILLKALNDAYKSENLLLGADEQEEIRRSLTNTSFDSHILRTEQGDYTYAQLITEHELILRRLNPWKSENHTCPHQQNTYHELTKLHDKYVTKNHVIFTKPEKKQLESSLADCRALGPINVLECSYFSIPYQQKFSELELVVRRVNAGKVDTRNGFFNAMEPERYLNRATRFLGLLPRYKYWSIVLAKVIHPNTRMKRTFKALLDKIVQDFNRDFVKALPLDELKAVVVNGNDKFPYHVRKDLVGATNLDMSIEEQLNALAFSNFNKLLSSVTAILKSQCDDDIRRTQLTFTGSLFDIFEDEAKVNSNNFFYLYTLSTCLNTLTKMTRCVRENRDYIAPSNDNIVNINNIAAPVNTAANTSPQIINSTIRNEFESDWESDEEPVASSISSTSQNQSQAFNRDSQETNTSAGIERKSFNDRFLDAGGQMENVKDYICPITQCLIDDPVAVSSGNIYEREALRGWFGSEINKNNSVVADPINRKDISISELNNATCVPFKNSIEKLVIAQEEKQKAEIAAKQKIVKEQQVIKENEKEKEKEKSSKIETDDINIIRENRLKFFNANHAAESEKDSKNSGKKSLPHKN